MSEPTVTKRCWKCKQTQFISEFYRDKSRKDGFQPVCNTCHKARRKTAKYKAVKKAYQERYRQTESAKICYRQCAAKQRVKFPERIKATNAVGRAVKTERLPRADTLKCSCGEQAKEYHHHKGYAKEHWLDVVPKCKQCHVDIHQATPLSLCSLA